MVLRGPRQVAVQSCNLSIDTGRYIAAGKHYDTLHGKHCIGHPQSVFIGRRRSAAVGGFVVGVSAV